MREEEEETDRQTDRERGRKRERIAGDIFFSGVHTFKSLSLMQSHYNQIIFGFFFFYFFIAIKALSLH